MSNYKKNENANRNTFLNYTNKGSTIEINLPQEGITNGYSVECTYKYNKYLDKYMLSMWIKNENDNDGFMISHKHINTMPVSGNRETIIENICRIVDQATRNGYFKSFIKDYEQVKRYCEKGRESMLTA